MDCKQYELFENGEISQPFFELHVKSCQHCQHEIKLDKHLLDVANTLSNPGSTPDLWPQINKNIIGNKSILRLPPFSVQLFKVAAAILIAVSMIVFFNYQTDYNADPILSSSALLKVEQKEKEYLRAIEQLEQIASTRAESFDINLALLYRDKLETIDSQIERCQDALKGNPANTHIRRYLIAALEDKKETLKEILQ